MYAWEPVARLGLGNSMSSSFLMALGLVLQQGATKPSPESRSIDDPQYAIGMACVLLGAATGLVCYGFLPQSTLAPLTCQTIIYKTLLGKLILNKHITKLAWLSMIFMSVGMVVAVCGANLRDYAYTPQVVLEQFSSRLAIEVSGAVFLAMVLFRALLARLSTGSGDFSSGLGLAYLCASSGVLSGWGGAFAKAAVELALGAVAGGESSLRSLAHPTMAGMMLAAAACTGLRLKVVNDGIAAVGAETFLPLHHTAAISGQVFAGCLFYRDFSLASTSGKGPGAAREGTGGGRGDFLVFAVGLGATLAGVLLLLLVAPTTRVGVRAARGGGGGGGGGGDGGPASDTTPLLESSAESEDGGEADGGRRLRGTGSGGGRSGGRSGGGGQPFGSGGKLGAVARLVALSESGAGLAAAVRTTRRAQVDSDDRLPRANPFVPAASVAEASRRAWAAAAQAAALATAAAQAASHRSPSSTPSPSPTLPSLSPSSSPLSSPSLSPWSSPPSSPSGPRSPRHGDVSLSEARAGWVNVQGAGEGDRGNFLEL